MAHCHLQTCRSLQSSTLKPFLMCLFQGVVSVVEEEEVMETDLEDEEMTTTAVADLVVAEEAEARIGRGLGAVVGGERGARAGLEAATGEEDQGEGTTKTPTATETTTVLVTVEQEDMGMEAGGEEVVGVEEVEDLTGAVRKTGLKGRADGEMKVMIRRKEELRLTKTTQTVETMPNPSWRTLTLVLRLQATRSRIV